MTLLGSNIDELYYCGYCKNHFQVGDMAKWYRKDDSKWADYNKCLFCSYDEYFKNLAKQYILTVYKIYAMDCPPELLEIETIRVKIRYAIRTGNTKYITFKQENMITTVNNSTELRQALNENLHALLTKKRKLIVAKEVNNTLGKILVDVKMELMQNALVGNREVISWFSESNTKQIGETYGVIPRLKQVQ